MGRERRKFDGFIIILDDGPTCLSRLTASVTRWWMGRDNATLPEPAQAQKSLKKRADSHQSGAPPHDRSVMFHEGTRASSENAVLGCWCASLLRLGSW